MGSSDMIIAERNVIHLLRDCSSTEVFFASKDADPSGRRKKAKLATWVERAKAASDTLVASYQSLPRPPSFPSLPIDSLPRSIPLPSVPALPYISQLPLPSWLAPGEAPQGELTEEELAEQIEKNRSEQASSSKDELLRKKEAEALKLLQSQVMLLLYVNYSLTD